MSELTFESVLDQIWENLAEGALKRKHAFHFGVLANVVDGLPYARQVVLRHCDRETRTIGCNCDNRSAKFDQFRSDPNASWVFYDPVARVQVRAAGLLTPHVGDAIAKAAWDETRIFSRKCYLVSGSPGELVDEPRSGLPEHLQCADPTWEESEHGWDSFGVLRCQITQLDWLWLNSKGHRRANLRWENGTFSGQWMIP